jgi:2-dehydropantoate 2-reductase
MPSDPSSGVRVASESGVNDSAAAALGAPTPQRTPAPDVGDAPEPAAPRPPSQRTLVVGAGAVGSFLGGLLATAGHDVTLVRIFEPDSNRPLDLVRPDSGRVTLPMRRMTRTEDAPVPDLILVAVRMPALREALAPTLRWPEVPTLTVQNGLGADETALELRPRAPVIAASLTAPISLTSEDEVRWLGRGGIGLAAATGSAARLLGGLESDFRAAGLRAATVPDWRAMKWSKLLANLLANASGAVLDMDPSSIYADPRLFDIERRQVLEALAVMEHLGIRPVRLPGAAVPWLVRGLRLPPAIGRPILARVVGGARAGKLPSLRLHLQAAPDGPTVEQTEAAWMNGAVAAAGQRSGCPAPVNARLAELVDEVAADPERRRWLRGRPDRFLAEFA